ncbi:MULTISPECIES: sulfur oxidation c-type cytochrome SoxX [unclassified Minwuia]|jgi:L-cysteine S-thiosulfotransferase|uniref:sulfur oxidation c-type cytochrome SoxX n=1 Tax=unclassified Minwuia TaxID=2618799 RepID=UPI002478F442|nr:MULTISPECIES: sulfur oxidation c-type cytochrome SoxX [unclassified Minwuia]
MRKYCAECVILSNHVAALLLAVIGACCTLVPARAQQCSDLVAQFVVREGGIDRPLCGRAGDAARGRVIVAGRQGNCLACHAAPIPEQAFHGDIGPPLHGVAGRLSEAELRLQVVDATRINEETVMPPFHRVAGLTGVRRDRVGQPLLSAMEVEDVIAYLLTLKQDQAQE